MVEYPENDEGSRYNNYRVEKKDSREGYEDSRGMIDHKPHGPVEADVLKENSLEEEIDLLDHLTRKLNDVMNDINLTRNRIYTKRMQNDEKEAKLGAYLNKILQSDSTETTERRY